MNVSSAEIVWCIVAFLFCRAYMLATTWMLVCSTAGELSLHRMGITQANARYLSLSYRDYGKEVLRHFFLPLAAFSPVRVGDGRLVAHGRWGMYKFMKLRHIKGDPMAIPFRETVLNVGYHELQKMPGAKLRMIEDGFKVEG